MNLKPIQSILTAACCRSSQQLTIKRHFKLIFCAALICGTIFGTAAKADTSVACQRYFEGSKATRSSFNEVLEIMERNPYAWDKLPEIPIRLWNFIGKRMSFFVGRRSKEILADRSDYRQVPMEKPIHSMGVGLVGKITMFATPWSGVFAGGEFTVIGRASISQGNALKTTTEGEQQKRSTAMALKIFDTQNPNEKTTTANAVFQNDLNGLFANDGKALNFLDSAQTNNPNVDFSKIQYSYEWLTLIGVAVGSITTPKDHTRKFPFINPQIRPVHSLSELGVATSDQIRTPTWVKIQPRKPKHRVEESDFRLEIARTMEVNSEIIYDIFASDFRSPNGEIQWIPAGVLIFNRAILSEGVDQNLLFAHDSLNSKRSGQAFTIPEPRQQYQTIDDDKQ